MHRITHVLCPVDFSEISQHAVDYAAAIAGWYDARLTLVHAFVNLPTMDVPPPVLEDADRQRLHDALRRMAARAPDKIRIETVVEQSGSVHAEVARQLEATQADLLVLGTHGRSGFQRLFLGSVTEKLIRQTTCPTLVVPPRAPDVPADRPVQFRRILCAVDFATSSLDALRYALNLAQEADAKLTLLHVVDIPLGSDHESGPDALRSVREAVGVDARRRLQELVPEEARTYSTIDVQVARGRAYTEVLRQAAEHQADLIVMGVHGRSSVEQFLFGSTAHHVVRAAACPVLIVRHRPDR
jgi:nucleotide-binding universal stress UspA family protein